MSESTVTATVNGETRSLAAGTTVAALVRSLGADPERVVVERNRDILPKDAFERTAVEDGDSLEIVQFVGGG